MTVFFKSVMIHEFMYQYETLLQKNIELHNITHITN